MSRFAMRWLIPLGAMIAYLAIMYMLVRVPLTFAPTHVSIEGVTSGYFVGDIQQTDTGITFRWLDARIPMIIPVHAPGSIISFTTWLYPADGVTTPANHAMVSFDERLYTTTSDVFVPRHYRILSLYGMSPRHDLRGIMFIPYPFGGETPYWAFSGVTAVALTMPSLHTSQFVLIFILILLTIPLSYAGAYWSVTGNRQRAYMIAGAIALCLIVYLPALYTGYVGMRYRGILGNRILVAVVLAVIIMALIAISRRYNQPLQRIRQMLGVHLPSVEPSWFWGTTLVIAALWGAVTWDYVRMNAGDWGIHITHAYQLMNHGKFISHFLFQAMLIGIHYLSIGLLSLELAAVVLVILIMALICLVLWNMGARVWPQPLFLVGTTLLVCLSAPIAVLYAVDGHLYTGYFATNVFHNPTVLMVKPLALLHVLMLISFFTHAPHDDDRVWWGVLWGITLLGVLAKPSYAIAMIPAHGLVVGWRLWQRHPWWRRDIATLIISASAFAIPLIIQFVMLYYAGSRSIGIKSLSDITASACMASTQPFWSCVIVLYGTAIIKGIASAAILLIIWRVVPRITQHIDIQLLGIASMIGIVYAYVMREGVGSGGVSEMDNYGNFGWSIQIILFLCMAVAIPHVGKQLRQAAATPTWSYAVLYGVAGAHLVSGLVWYATQFWRCCW
ncbi:MAG: hypothetical protein ACK5C8_00500 [Roseiflexaceae bacterium]|jgi:hypothetical protein